MHRYRGGCDLFGGKAGEGEGWALSSKMCPGVKSVPEQIALSDLHFRSSSGQRQGWRPEGLSPGGACGSGGAAHRMAGRRRVGNGCPLGWRMWLLQPVCRDCTQGTGWAQS